MAEDPEAMRNLLTLQLQKEAQQTRAAIAQKKAATPSVSIVESSELSPHVDIETEDGKHPSVVADAETKANPQQTFTPAFAEMLKHSDIERLTSQKISTASYFYETTIPYQQYLQLRQNQIAEFSAMGEWYRNKKAELETAAQAKGISDETAMRKMVAEELHNSFVQRYRDMFYLHQTSGEKITDPDNPGSNISTLAHRLVDGDALDDRFFDYDPLPWQHKDKDAQVFQLYALMEMFDGITMDITPDEKNKKDFNFTIKLKEEKLLTGVQHGNKIEISCSAEILNGPNCDRALCLMVDQRKRLLGRTYGVQDDSFPIHGSAKAETLVRLYQLALVQNMNPKMDKDCMDSIIEYDKEHGTYYSHILAHLILIKQQAGKIVTPEETAFMQNQIGDKYPDLQQAAIAIEQEEGNSDTKINKGYLGRRLQQFVIGQAHDKLVQKYGLGKPSSESKLEDAPLELAPSGSQSPESSLELAPQSLPTRPKM